MAFFDTEAAISKDPIVGLIQEAGKDDHENKLTAIIGSAADDEGKLIVPQAVIDTAKELTEASINMAYAPSTGIPGLAEALSLEILGQKTSKNLEAAGVHRAEIVTSAGTNAIATTLLSCTNEKDLIITHNPHWAGYDSVALAINRKPLINFDILDTDENFNFAAFESIIKNVIATNKSAKLTILINTPFDNPLGKDFGVEAWNEIGDILAKYNDRDITVVLDTAYIDFGPEGKDYRRLSFLPELFKKVNSPNFKLVVAGTVSKSFAMYGARVGVATLLTSSEEEAKAWRDTAGGTIRGTFSNATRFTQEIVLSILQDAKKLADIHQFQEDTAKLLNTRREHFAKCIEGKLSKEFKLIKADSGFFSTIMISDKKVGNKTFAQLFYEKLLESHTYAPLISGQFLRVPVCGLSEAKLGELADRLIKINNEVLALN